MSDDIAVRARRRTRAVVGVAAAVVMVIGTAVAGLVVALGHRAAPVSQPVPSATAAALGRPSSGGGPQAPPSASDSVSPGGQDIGWVSVAGAKVPVSATAGPRDRAGGRALGFTHTDLGAVLAAAHISLRLCPQVGPSVFEATLREQVVGADAAALRQHLEDDYTAARAQLGLPYGAAAGQLYSTARGYRVRVTADTADVGLLIEGPGTSGSVLVALSIQMQWVADDWALVAPAGGTWDAAASVTTDPTGYTPFANGG